MKKLTLLFLTTLSLCVFSAHHESQPMTTDGAFTTLMVSAPDIEKYTKTLRNKAANVQSHISKKLQSDKETKRLFK